MPRFNPNLLFHLLSAAAPIQLATVPGLDNCDPDPRIRQRIERADEITRLAHRCKISRASAEILLMSKRAATALKTNSRDRSSIACEPPAHR